jgi:hypothetical protein
MMPILAALGIVSLVAGLLLSAFAVRRYGSSDAPQHPTFNPRGWKPVWKSRSWFVTDRGFHLDVLGTELIGLGALISLVVVWLV